MSASSTQRARLQQPAYEAINAYWTEHADEVLEIEILPPDLEPTDSFLLQDGRNLGLPKKVLLLAFMHARSLFLATRHSLTPEDQITALQATRVILLFDPEFLTAANHRKRSILSLQNEDINADVYIAALNTEHRFLDSVLTSPLHRQSKSPTLWSHRFWLLSQISPALSGPIPTQSEIEAVCTSGERHPKNYYAWQYARRIYVHNAAQLPKDEWETLLKWGVVRVNTWCCKHPSDVSGWSFLGWMLKKARPETVEAVLRQVVQYAVSVCLANESLWVFVRTVLADGTAEEELVRSVLDILKDVLRDRSVGLDLLFTHQIERTLEWVEKYKR